MTVIDSYLDTLFAPYPDSPRLRTARAELHAMMEDKLTDLQREGLTETQALGRVIAEFGSLDEVAPVLGIEREVGDRAHHDATTPAAARDDRPRLDVGEVEEYIALVRRAQPLHALAVAVFVACPIPLILLLALTQDGGAGAQNVAVAIGVTAVLVIVALGVLLVTRREARVRALEHGRAIIDGSVTVTAQAARRIEELRRVESTRTSFTKGLAVVLFIVAAVPTVVLAVIGDGGASVLLGVCLTIAIVAVGVHLIIRATWADQVGDALLGTADDDDLERISESSPLLGVFLAVYWPIIVAAYFAWSFIRDGWGVSWVIWPIAGVLYGALWTAAGILVQARRRESAPRR